MGRPPKGPNPTVSVTARLDTELVNEIDDLSKALRGNNRSALLQEIIGLGLEAWKKQNPKALDLLKDYYKREKISRSFLKAKTM